jgi:hypothetical protein
MAKQGQAVQPERRNAAISHDHVAEPTLLFHRQLIHKQARST